MSDYKRIMLENDLGDRMVLGLPYSSTVSLDTPNTIPTDDAGSQVISNSPSAVSVPLPVDPPIPLPTDPAVIKKDVDQIKTKVSPDEIVTGLQYVLKRMVFKDKRRARDIVLQCLKHDPKYFSSLSMIGITDDSSDFIDRLMVRETYQALTGGVGDNLSPDRIDPSELEMGIKVEMEHTNDITIAREIASDHLAENPRYYSDLKSSGMAPELASGNSSSANTSPAVEVDVVEPISHYMESYSKKKLKMYEAQFWGKQGAGALILCSQTKRFLIAKRSEDVNEPHTWGIWGGAIDANELPESAVERELHEETGYSGDLKLIPLVVFKSGEFKYHNFLAIVSEEFEPELNWETETFVWTDLENFPTPLHFGLKFLLQHSKETLKQHMDGQDHLDAANRFHSPRV